MSIDSISSSTSSADSLTRRQVEAKIAKSGLLMAAGDNDDANGDGIPDSQQGGSAGIAALSSGSAQGVANSGVQMTAESSTDAYATRAARQRSFRAK